MYIYLIQFNIDMDCDGLKKNLLIDTDGSLFGLPSTVFSEAEYLWGNSNILSFLLIKISFFVCVSIKVIKLMALEIIVFHQLH